jgi:uncharacterized protein (TIGR02453 family)
MIKLTTLNFLKDLALNNNREWFQDNKQVYEDARENVVEFTAALINELTKLDPDVTADTDAKKCIMRIYRDIRFSKDKTPYKNNFGIGRLVSGTKVEDIGYYVHIRPGESFAGGGYWMPQAGHLKAIRQEIDYNADDLKKIIDKTDFKRLFGEFRNQEQLKSTPRDYDADNENIGLLKLKSFAAMHPLKDEELLKPDAPKRIAVVLANIYPLNVFLNNAIA